MAKSLSQRASGVASTRWHPLMLTLLVAVAYCAAGKLALLLAIPPGYATAVWPPAGIALAACLLYGRRAWAGIWIGSFLANISTSLDLATSATMFRSVALAVVVGGGAALQAVVTSLLIDKFAHDSRALTSGRQVFCFFALAGPIGCLINATIGVASLIVADALPPSGAAFSWWTWWIGDSIGSLIFTPLLLMWLGELREWQARRWSVTIPLAMMLAVAVLVFVYASQAEQRDARDAFAADAARITNHIERRLALDVETLRAVSGLFVASARVEPEEFARLAALLLPSHPEIRSLAWAPRVPAAERVEFEAALRERGITNGIWQHRAHEMPAAEPHGELFPILMNAGPASSPHAMGFDLAADTARREAIQHTIATRHVTATGQVTIHDTAMTTAGISILLPVDTQLAGQARVEGVVVGTLHIGEVIARALEDFGDERILLTIEDVSDVGAERVLFRSESDAAHLLAQSAAARDMATARNLTIGSRAWLITFTPTPDYLASGGSFVAWLVLASGLAITALVGAGALILTGRTQEIAELVRTRTEELALINEKLADEICEHINTESKLNSEREFLQTVLENLDEGILVHDENGELTMANRAAREVHTRIVGEPSETLDAPNRYRLFEVDGRTPIPPESVPRVRALGGETIRDLAVVAIAENRAPVDLMLTSQPLVDAGGHRGGVITIMRDISATKRADRMKSEFVSVVSHELRTPLTSIRGSLGLVCGGAAGALPSKAQHLLEIAYRNTDRLTLLINDILDIDKIESGKTQLDMKPMLLAPLLTQAIEANAAYAASCEVQLHLHFPIPNASVKVDANRLLQVMANLLSNAAKFSPRGATVDITVTTTDTYARVCVRDDGPGIPMEFRSRVFQKFSQADGSDSRSKPGTGLGLAISKALIERMHGTIGFESQPGCGALFYFELPLVSMPAGASTPS